MPIFKNKNEGFFKKWTPEMAYVLGFFTADGSMIKNKRGAHFIEFEIIDKDLLFKIRDLLGSDHKITERKRIRQNKVAYRLQIGSKKMFNDLLKIGLTPNKSKTLYLPNIANKYFSDFVRGYFDGDGNVISGYFKKPDRKSKSYSISTRFISGSRIFLEGLKLKLTEELATKGSLSNYGGAWRLHYSIRDSKKLFAFMYKNNVINSSIYLERKYNIFLNAGVA